MLIPALDLIQGQIVRLKQGDFNDKTVFNVDPLERVQQYTQDGARLIHIVDLDGAKDVNKRQLELIKAIVKSTTCAIQTGGGIRTYEDIKTLLDLGVKRVVVGSAAVNDIDFGHRILQEFGSESICLALDVKIDQGIPKVATHGWLKLSDNSLYDLIDEFTKSNLEHILVTDISKDGMMQGTNVDLYAALAKRYPNLDVIASGGVSCLEDLRALQERGAKSVVLGKSLLSGAFSLKEALALWPN